MKLLLFHLSDAHFSPTKFLPNAQINGLAVAGLNVEADVSHVVIVLSGDVAATGSEAEYEVAKAFLDQLKAVLIAANPRLNITTLAVPGNHDIADGVIGDAGDTLANDILQNQKELRDAEATYKLLLSSQSNYWHFDSLLDARAPQSLCDRLFRSIVISVGGYSIQVNLLNTAVLSRRHETQGKLWFPLSTTEDTKPATENNDFEISVFHHPYGWLESNNAVRFRQFVESRSDLVLSGHQHTPESFYSTSLEGGSTWYSAGSALVGMNTDDSGFAVFLFDFAEKSRRLVSVKWNGSLYATLRDTGLRKHAASLSTRRGYAITDTFASSLDDPESLIIHSQKRQILLPDVYEAPRLRGGLMKAGSATQVIPSEKICDALQDDEATYIFGEALSGKTCFSKQLFRQLLRRDGSCIPILLSGRDIKSSRPDDVDRWLRRAFRNQYKSPDLREFLVLEKKAKIAIVDDWHAIQLNEVGKKAICRLLCSKHNHTILLCDSWFQMQEVASAMKEEDSQFPQNHFVILPLTPAQRSNMAARWLRIGRSEEASEVDYIYELDAAEKYLDELSRTRLMPPYPLYILTALQTLQAVRQSEPDLGAQGVLFNILISSKLSAVSEDAPELDINRQFIAYVAWDIFDREATGVSDERIQDLAKIFFERYAVSVKLDALLAKLVLHKVLHRADGYITYRHRYMYYYFVAEHFSSELSRRGTRTETLRRLCEMASFVAYEEYAQILMFVIYQTREQDLIDELIINSGLIFEGVGPSDLDFDVAFANRLEIRRPDLALPSMSVTQNREAQRIEMSDAEEESVDLSPSKVTYSQDLDEGAKMQYAFKTIQMLGRVLRNFPGTLEAPTKRELALGAYGVAFRLLREVLSSAERDLESLRELLSSPSDDDGPGDTLSDRFRRGDALLTSIITFCSFAIVRFLSTSVGSSKLEETYRQVGAELGSTHAVMLVDICIRMDYFRGLPVDDLYALDDRLRNNHVAKQVLRTLVWQRLLYLPVEDRNLRNQICKRFDIDSSAAPLLFANPPRK